jgi:hypothetical protein
LALLLGVCWAAVHGLSGCGQEVQVGYDDALSEGGADVGGTGGVAATGGAAGEAGVASGGAPACVETLCQGESFACGNCDDDDGDGLVDALDPECLGPCDNDELGLSSGISGNTSNACRQDCYFDSDSGLGNDECLWSHACDEHSIAPDYPPSGEARCEYMVGATPMGVVCSAAQAAQPTTCLDVCLPLVPNGCDCFGCCELPARSNSYHFIGSPSGCGLDQLDDPIACPPCTPVRSCLNTCERCEACVGGSPESDCEPEAACKPGHVACPEGKCGVGQYCITGCCVNAPPK